MNELIYLGFVKMWKIIYLIVAQVKKVRLDS